MKKRRKNRRNHFIDSLGGECVRCGEKENLQFDHIDRKTKEFDINQIQDGSMERLENEMKKIQLLCPKCHLQKSIENNDLTNLNKSPARCGTLHQYRNKGCRCDDCLSVNREYLRNRKVSKQSLSQ